MELLGINIVTIIITAIIIISIYRGMTNDFHSEDIFRSISYPISNMLFIVSLAASIYVVKNIFFNTGNSGIYKIIRNLLPKSAVVFILSNTIFIYVFIIPMVLLGIFSILQFVKSLCNRPIMKASEFICSQVGKTSKIVRGSIGIMIEIPGMLVKVIVLVFLISLINTYFPANSLLTPAVESKEYNYVYEHAVSPVMNSSFGRNIPIYIWSSIGEISTDIGNSKILKNLDTLKTLGFFRFQYETSSNQDIDSKAKKIVGNETDERRKAYLLYKWIGNNINYDWGKYNNIVDGTALKNKFGAVQAFNTSKGVCEDYADLYVAMAKAVGLNVRIVVGQGYAAGTWGGHAWNEVYIHKDKIWIPIDTTWAKAGDYFDNKGFYKEHIIEAIAGEW